MSFFELHHGSGSPDHLKAINLSIYTFILVPVFTIVAVELDDWLRSILILKLQFVIFSFNVLTELVLILANFEWLNLAKHHIVLVEKERLAWHVDGDAIAHEFQAFD